MILSSSFLPDRDIDAEHDIPKHLRRYGLRHDMLHRDISLFIFDTVVNTTYKSFNFVKSSLFGKFNAQKAVDGQNTEALAKLTSIFFHPVVVIGFLFVVVVIGVITYKKKNQRNAEILS